MSRTDQLTYTYEEIMADHAYAARLRRGPVLFHGGLDSQGRYVPPRSRHRIEAIDRWTARLAAEGHPTRVIHQGQVKREFFPNVGQAKLLLHSGARGAMTRILTLIGITEGFGNDGIKIMPVLDLQGYFKEAIDGTCLAHLYKGLLEAHGNDEAGRGEEAGHDVMWYAIRDAALDNPSVTPDMFENLPIAPPPGYTGPAKPAPEALSVGNLMSQLFPQLDPLFELLLSAFAQILLIELLAYPTFSWAYEVLSDSACSADPEFASRMVECITRDENIHVAYLQCALAETRCRTLLTRDGTAIPGQPVVDAICDKIIRNQMGTRWERMLAYRMDQIRAELSERRDGELVLQAFAVLGSIPQAAPPPAIAAAS